MLFNPSILTWAILENRTFYQAIFILTLFFSVTTSAQLPNEPITITADTAEQDDVKGTTVYSGSVLIVQGGLSINADRVVIQSVVDKDASAQRQIDVIRASGKPATFVQDSEAGNPPVRASGNSIRYWLDKGLVLLEHDANIDQQGSSVSGDAIEYFIDQQRVRAKADDTREGSRVQTIIAPARKAPKDSASPPSDATNTDTAPTTSPDTTDEPSNHGHT